MDEYVDLPRDHPESYHSFIFNILFKHINIDPANVNILDSNASNLEDECNAYEYKIIDFGGIDLFVVAIDPDSSNVFNEPAFSLVSRTKSKIIAMKVMKTISANTRFISNDITKDPHEALTVGVVTIVDARDVIFLATGPDRKFAPHDDGVSHI